MYDLIPFQQMIDFGLAGIMPAHVIYPKWMQNPLVFDDLDTKNFTYGITIRGLYFSDDLSMRGAEIIWNMLLRAQAGLAQVAI